MTGRLIRRAVALFVGVVLGMLAVPAPAHADSRIPAAEAIAAQTWGPVCGGQAPTILTGEPTDYAADYSGVNSGLAGFAVMRDCAIDLAPWAQASWWRLCTVMVHEWGHLAGEQHSRNPRSVMYPVIERPFHRCHGSHPPV